MMDGGGSENDWNRSDIKWVRGTRVNKRIQVMAGKSRNDSSWGGAGNIIVRHKSENVGLYTNIFLRFGFCKFSMSSSTRLANLFVKFKFRLILE